MLVGKLMPFLGLCPHQCARLSFGCGALRVPHTFQIGESQEAREKSSTENLTIACLTFYISFFFSVF